MFDVTEQERTNYSICTLLSSRVSRGDCERMLHSYHLRELDAVQQIFNLPAGEQFRFPIPPVASDEMAQAYYWYLDEDCNAVEANDSVEICGFAGLSWSPISLILGEISDLELDNTVVQFRLSPLEEAKFSIWKASHKTPLLVFDPDDTEDVVGARQLFGNFAFGGRTANINDYYSKEYREPWATGYEALALLDHNKDGKLTGEELVDLRLWFDINRNGSVEAGELKKLSDLGVMTIFYRDPQKREDTNDYVLKVGYQRLIDGKTVNGTSVDWFVESFSSQSEALAAITGKYAAAVLNSDTKGQKTAVNHSDNTGYSSAAEVSSYPDKVNNAGALSGYWIWTLKDDGGDNTPGFFVFGEDQNGTVSGYTITEGVLKSNRHGLRSMMMAIWGEGTVTRDEDGRVAMEILFFDRSSGGIAKSRAILSADGQVLTGSTKQTFGANIRGQAHSTTIEYSWAATKVRFRG